MKVYPLRVPRCIHHRRRRLSKIVSAQRRVWCLLLRLRLKYLFRRASLSLKLPYTWSFRDLATGYFASPSRSLPPSSRSLPPDRVRLQGPFGVTGRITRLRLPPICAFPISPQSNNPSISFTESTIHSKSILSRRLKALRCSSHGRVFDTPVRLPPTISDFSG